MSFHDFALPNTNPEEEAARLMLVPFNLRDVGPGPILLVFALGLALAWLLR
jgi:hypothetical protein